MLSITSEVMFFNLFLAYSFLNAAVGEWKMSVIAQKVTSEFGALLRRWRQIQGLSQLDLAMSADSSARHISFIETGRSKPSSEMVLRLCSAMGLSLRDRNRMLTEAGYRAAYTENALDGDDMEYVRRAMDMTLTNHDPYPALVMNRCFDILMINQSGAKMLQVLGLDDGPETGPPNILRMMLHPDGFRNIISNWEAASQHLVQRAHRQVRKIDGGEDPLYGLLDEVLSYPGIPTEWASEDPSQTALPVLPVEMVLGGQKISWISTIASFGTPQDVTAEEVMIECMYPADQNSDSFYKAIMAG
jgi:transcriptional regulator with XRE-family HTH domain